MSSSDEVIGAGQSPQAWSSFWSGTSPESEIQMWDFYGGRPWILKHVPRHGRVVEAGSGMGRYVFLLSRLGIAIDGVDFHAQTVAAVQAWGRAYAFTCEFQQGDVLNLPYDDSSLSGYLSFGVIEHFQEGPGAALMEAKRVLRPGGVAVITTPSPSPSQLLLQSLSAIRRGLRRGLGRPLTPRPFFQFWYSAQELERMLTAAGLTVVLAGTADLRYSLYELESRFGKVGLGFRLADRLEATWLSRFGAQSLTVSIKAAENMHCFLCGELRAIAGDLRRFYMPICADCSTKTIAQFYRVPTAPQFTGPCEYNPPLPAGSPSQLVCAFCGTAFQGDPLFEGHYGFDVPICPDCLRKPDTNILAANQHLKQVWRQRGSTPQSSGAGEQPAR